MVKRIAAVLLVVAALGGALTYSQLKDEPLEVSGYIEADEIRLGSRVGGRVDEVLVAEGEEVEPGQPLVQLEPYDLLEREKEALAILEERQAELRRLEAGNRKLEIEQAKARFDELTATLEKLQEGPRKQEKAAAAARLAAARAEAEYAERDFKRIQEIAKTGGQSVGDLDLARQKLEVANALVLAREQELELLNAGTREEEIVAAQFAQEQARLAWELAKEGAREEDIAKARAAVAAAKAAVEAIAEQKKELTIVSPVNGVVEALELQKGDLVGAGSPVLSLMDVEKLWVRAYVPEDELDIELHQRVPVTVDSYPGETFDGEITFISRQAEFTPSNVQTPEERSKQVFRIKVTLLEGLDKLRPGMAADVHLEGQ